MITNYSDSRTDKQRLEDEKKQKSVIVTSASTSISMGKKILLIAPLSEQYSGIRNYGVPSIGVHRLASFLNANGQDVTVYDCNIHGDIENYLKESYDIIGISILNDTLALSLEMFIKLRKRFPKVLFVAGGAEAILNYQEIYDNTEVSIIVLGEGELPMLDICNDKPLGDIKGIITRRNGTEITDNLLWDYYKDIDFIKMGWREYWKMNREGQANDKEHEKNIVRLVTSSHCNRGCSFCSLTKLHEFSCGSKVKPAVLSGVQIRILIDRILEQLPETSHIYFVEDSILPTVKRIDDFCWALEKYKGRLEFLVQTETDKVSRSIIEKLSKVSVCHITYGIENASENVRITMGKRQNKEKIESIVDWCDEFNIRCYYLVILFYPSSLIQDMIENYNILNRWIKDKRVTISIEPFCMPYRGAKLYNEDYKFDYKITKLSNGKILKHPYIVYPSNKEVNQLMLDFRDKIPEYFEAFEKESGHVHKSKDHTGKIYVKLLGDLLREKKYI